MPSITRAWALLLGLLATSCNAIGNEFAVPEPSTDSGYTSKVALDFGPFESSLSNLDADPGRADELAALLLPEDVGVSDVQALLNDGELTSEELVTFFVRRIRDHDVGVFNSVAQLNPKALEEARASDARRSGEGTGDAVNGSVGDGTPRPLEGVPVLVKWNIAVADLPTTAGAVAMKDWIPSRDAHLVNNLRAHGAVILGHANLSEWANYLDPDMPDGFSAMGGQTRPAYGLYDPWGSSTGSAVAVSANFASLAVGTETSGSIIMPSVASGVVGLRPSTGLVSGDRVIPLCSALDTAGPIARSVEDLAVALTAMAGVEPGAPSSPADELMGVDFAKFATADGAGEILVGIPEYPGDAVELVEDPRLRFPPGSGTPLDEETVKAFVEYFEGENAEFAKVGNILKEAGVEVITFDPIDLMFHGGFNLEPFLEYCMKDSLDSFASSLASTESTFPLATLAEVVSFNDEDPANFIPYGQDYLQQTVETAITAEEFDRMQNDTISAAQDMLDGLFAASGADVLFVGSSQAYSIAGYPALTVPSGYLPVDVSTYPPDPSALFLPEGGGVQPEGIVFSAPHLGEEKLIRVGYIYERATRVRVNPDLEGTAAKIAAALNGTAAYDLRGSTSSSGRVSFNPLFFLMYVGISIVNQQFT